MRLVHATRLGTQGLNLQGQVRKAHQQHPTERNIVMFEIWNDYFLCRGGSLIVDAAINPDEENLPHTA